MTFAVSEREVHTVDFKKLLSQNEFIFLDGAMGTMLQKSGLEAGEIPELLNLTHPDMIKNIHRMYIDAGSQIVYANTFGANRYKLEDCGHSVDEVIGTGIAIAKRRVLKAAKKHMRLLISGLSVSCWSLREALPLRKHTTFSRSRCWQEGTLTLSSSRP